MTRALLVTLLVALPAACHHAAPPDPPVPVPPPPTPGFVDCDAVTLEADGTLVMHRADAAIGTLPLGDGAMTGGWADREHLFVRAKPGEVALVTRLDVTRMPVPGTDPLSHLVVTGGEAWWAQCTAVAGDECTAWASERLWPEPQTKVEALVDGPVGTNPLARPR